MCERTGCEDQPGYTDKDGEMVCGSCMQYEISTGHSGDGYTEMLADDLPTSPVINPHSESFSQEEMELNESAHQEEIKEGREILESMEVRDVVQVSIIPPIEDEEKLTVFIENLTAERLDSIQFEINNLPTIISNKTYDSTYDMHQMMKKFRQLLKKSVTSKLSKLKSDFETGKMILNSDHGKVLAILGPMEDQLADARLEWDKAKKEKLRLAAEQQAITDALEVERIRLVRATEYRLQEEQDEDFAINLDYLRDESEAYVIQQEMNQEDEAAQLESAAMSIEQERLDLEREKFEFQCEKSRLSPDDAWDYWYSDRELGGLKSEYPELSAATLDVKDGSVSDSDVIAQPELADPNNYLSLPTFETERKDGLDQRDSIDTKISEMEQDLNATLDNNKSSHLSAFSEMAGDDSDLDGATVIICKNPEQGFIDTMTDDSSLLGIKNDIEDLIALLKAYEINDQSKQQKLNVFIFNIETNFKNFKNGVK